ncbi:MAG: 2Fe-2S iron-sulfur cluster binding domain-containing protein [Actinomycetia bacterium]|nr:2Fe-2S iron-sulfur cluster binding domain-containing protein [Actinomycetes bacterium]MCP3912757.1 2Fe-2S iron-sulfur cluster binding domain-containing protein [Actinomycetes bacterium]MCP4086533.1 2Fe-2S iron-sulfur cluster binding domain-containing protein [Actinomycetes bacterium]
MAVEFHSLPVRVQPETDDSVAVTFEVPAELRDTFRHVPGQHLVLRADLDGEDVRRSYSICTSRDCGELKVAIKRIPDGVFSTWATTELADGDTLDVMAPIGEFGYQPDPSTVGSYAAFAAGSGITPVLSILTSILEVEKGSRCTLVYGNRRVGSIMFLEELEGLKNRYPDRFQTIHILSREPHEIPLFEGRIDTAKIRTLTGSLLPVADIDAWFLCGPLDMVETAQATLAELGVADDQVNYELFFDERIEVVPEADGGEDSLTMTVTVDGRSSTVGVDPDGPSLLDYARSVRSEVPFACKGGMCATCKGKVLEGEVTMDKNYALTHEELAEGFVLTCQSHATDTDVSISYDVHGGLGR